MRPTNILIALFLTAAPPALFSQQQNGAEVFYEEYHDTSGPIAAFSSNPVIGVRTLKVRPWYRRPAPVTAEQPDAAIQTEAAPLVAAAIGLNFDGIPDSANVSLGVPPDSNLAVGATQVVETINTAYEVYDKVTGASVMGPNQISNLFTGVTGLCGQGANSPNFTDPIVLYDQIAGRWLISIVAANSGFTVGKECIAVSTTSDATGTYHRYVFGFGTGQRFNDYPKLAIWPDGYYASYNLFSPTAFLTALACAYDRNAMLAGTAAKAVCFSKPSEFAFLPSNLDGSTLPPNGEPNFFVDLFSSTALHLFRFHVDFVTTSNSTFSGPITITVAAYTQACPVTGTCIPQLGTAQSLDSLGDRLMHRLAYRNFTTHESLVVNHSVKTSSAAAGVRWYEIRNPNGTPVAFQQSTLTNASTSLWMGSIAMDKMGDMALGFSESSTSIHPSIAFTGRMPSDPLNTMEAPAPIFAGKGSQTGGTANGGSRWGDYSGMAIDPVDDCTFWYVNEYLLANGLFNFHTRLASLKFPSCP